MLTYNPKSSSTVEVYCEIPLVQCPKSKKKKKNPQTNLESMTKNPCGVVHWLTNPKHPHLWQHYCYKGKENKQRFEQKANFFMLIQQWPKCACLVNGKQRYTVLLLFVFFVLCWFDIILTNLYHF